jgi:hypothetical protein
LRLDPGEFYGHGAMGNESLAVVEVIVSWPAVDKAVGHADIHRGAVQVDE